MSRLFNAEFHRLIVYRPFWLEILFSAALAVYKILFNDYGYTPDIDGFMYTGMVILFGISGIVYALFVGEEYSCKTFRNKIACGHTRTDIYLTESLLCMLSLIFLICINITAVVISGKIRGWGYSSDILLLLKIFLCAVTSCAAVSCVIVFISINFASKVSGLIAVAAVSLVLGAFGIRLYGNLQEPEYGKHYVYDDNGDTQQEYIQKNPRYISGTNRVIQETCIILDPYSAAFYEGELMYDKEIPNDQSKIAALPFVKIPVYSVAECIVLTGIGIFLFKRKNLK